MLPHVINGNLGSTWYISWTIYEQMKNTKTMFKYQQASILATMATSQQNMFVYAEQHDNNTKLYLYKI